MSSQRAVSLLFIFLLGLGAPSLASAWTRTVVHSADATVNVERDGSMDVLLKLTVEVHAGWLHELELAGLGEDVQLDRGHAPYLRSTEGEVYRPETSLTEDGHIRLSFKRRGAPRKGEYRAIVRYRSKNEPRPLGGTPQGLARMSWTLPAWETGLHDVTVDIRAPKGARVPLELQDRGPGVQTSTTDRPGVTQIVWKRIHLPRHTPWTLAFDVPERSVLIPQDAPKRPVPGGFRPLEVKERRALPWALGILVCLVLLKRRSLQTLVGHHGLLVWLPWPILFIVSGVVIGVGGWVGPLDFVFALPLLAFALQRSPSGRSLRQTRVGVLLDGTTPPGLAACSALVIGLASLGQPIAALFILPIFYTGTRFHRGPSTSESKHGVLSFVRNLQLPEEAPSMALRWERKDGAAPSCRIVLPKERAGLIRMAFVSAVRARNGASGRRVMLLVETRAQSDADDLARRRLGAEPDSRTDDGQIGRLVEWGPEALQLIRAMSCPAPTEPLRASRGTWILREMTEREREAA